MFSDCVLLLLATSVFLNAEGQLVFNTWSFPKATDAAWEKLDKTDSALDAVEAGGNALEMKADPATYDSVGWGSHPDEKNQVTLDALIMDGASLNSGAVASMPKVKKAISVARMVMEHTQLSMLAGEEAVNFATEMGFSDSDLNSNYSREQYTEWKLANCQPNYWTDVSPNPSLHCGPYTPNNPLTKIEKSRPPVTIDNHDTLGIIVINSKGKIAAGLTTNGLSHKIPGRVGDAAIVGAGGYAIDGVGASVESGDGDTLMRFLPTFQAVNLMQQNYTPEAAVKQALQHVITTNPKVAVLLLAVNSSGHIGASCHGFNKGTYCIRSKDMKTKIVEVDCE